MTTPRMTPEKTLARLVACGIDPARLARQPYDLRGAGLRGAKLAGARLTDADLEGAQLAGARLTDADLEGADLRRADLAGAVLTRTRLTGAHLTRARLVGARLAGARLAGARLDGADLTDADLRGAKFTGADITGADLTGARWRRCDPPPAGWRVVAGDVATLVEEGGCAVSADLDRVAAWCDRGLDAMLAMPAMWGSLDAVEMQVMAALETLAYVRAGAPEGDAGDEISFALARRYADYLMETTGQSGLYCYAVPGATAETVARALAEFRRREGRVEAPAGSAPPSAETVAARLVCRHCSCPMTIHDHQLRECAAADGGPCQWAPHESHDYPLRRGHCGRCDVEIDDPDAMEPCREGLSLGEMMAGRTTELLAHRARLAAELARLDAEHPGLAEQAADMERRSKKDHG